MTAPSSAPRLGVFHCAAMGAVVCGVLFLLLCGAAAVADPRASQGTLVFLTQQALRSPTHTAGGVGLAALGGLALGALIALTYNLLRILTRP
jgi:hypothetical protein